MQIKQRLRETTARGTDLASRARWLIAVAALIVGLAMPLWARAETSGPTCNAPLDLIRLANPLSRVAQNLASNDPITVVALGSSSTAGAGASSPAANYPNRLGECGKKSPICQYFSEIAVSDVIFGLAQRNSQNEALI
jgi:hypothetical protein